MNQSDRTDYAEDDGLTEIIAAKLASPAFIELDKNLPKLREPSELSKLADKVAAMPVQQDWTAQLHPESERSKYDIAEIRVSVHDRDLIVGALRSGNEPPDRWVDTRLVRFDDTVNFGHGGFDFERWDTLRWEMHTEHGSFAVWKSSDRAWSMYGGNFNVLALDMYSDENSARADAEGYARSLSASSAPPESVTTGAPADIQQEITDCWNKLEEFGFPPEAAGFPFEDMHGKLPGAIEAALDCLIRQREALLAQAAIIHPRPDAVSDATRAIAMIYCTPSDFEVNGQKAFGVADWETAKGAALAVMAAMTPPANKRWHAALEQITTDAFLPKTGPGEGDVGDQALECLYNARRIARCALTPTPTKSEG